LLGDCRCSSARQLRWHTLPTEPFDLARSVPGRSGLSNSLHAMICNTLLEAATRIRAGQLFPSELLEESLAHIDRLESNVHAWVMVDRAAARQAAMMLDHELAAGIWRGPLHGIPVGIKDIFDVAGWPTRAGSPASSAQPVQQDAPLVARLRAAGAVILGKTVTTEWASFDPPPTRNPWQLDRTPGGSSSGSAAAVALRMCLGALGSQTGGSITRPASYCGVAGLKPTWGRLSTQGVVPLAYHMDHPGPLAPTVDDVAILYAVLAAELPSPQPPGQALPSPCTAPRAMEHVTATYLPGWSSLQPPTLGTIEAFFLERSSADVRQATLATLHSLEAHGARVTRLALPPEFAHVHACHRTIMAVEAAAVHGELFCKHRQQFGPQITLLLEEGLRASAVDYSRALQFRRQFQQAVAHWFAEVDAVVLPATPTAAPARDTTGDPAFNSPWSLAGVPVVSFPCALADDGMPLAIQLVGPAWGEGQLLATARWCEHFAGLRQNPPVGQA